MEKKNVSNMFSNCTNLKNISNWDLSRVTSITDIWDHYNDLKERDKKRIDRENKINQLLGEC
jgi:surface protein